MDLEAMTVDELDAFSVALKNEIEELRDTRREAKAVRDRKVVLAHLANRLGVDVSGITPEQAETLLNIANSKPRAGDVVVTPEPAHFDVSALAPDAEVSGD